MQSSKKETQQVWQTLAGLLEAHYVHDLQTLTSTFNANIEKIDRMGIDVSKNLENIMPHAIAVRNSQEEMGKLIAQIRADIQACNNLMVDREKAKKDPAGYTSGIQAKVSQIDLAYKKLAELRKAQKNNKLDTIPAIDPLMSQLLTIQSVMRSVEGDIGKIKVPEGFERKEPVIKCYNEIRFRCEERQQKTAAAIRKIQKDLQACDQARAGEANLKTAIDTCRGEVEAFKTNLRAFNQGGIKSAAPAPASASGLFPKQPAASSPATQEQKPKLKTDK